MFLPTCLARAPGSLPDGHVLLLNKTALVDGQGYTQVIPHKVKHIPFFSNYFPGSTVPSGPLTTEHTGRLCQLAHQYARAGTVAVIELNDPWHTNMAATVAGLHHSGPTRYSTALLHLPLSQFTKHMAKKGISTQKCLASLVDYGLMYTGTRERTTRSLDFVTPLHVSNTLHFVREKMEQHDKQDAQAVYNILNWYLQSALRLNELKGEKGVYVEPRHGYDTVVDISRGTPQQAGDALLAGLREVVNAGRPSEIERNIRAAKPAANPVCEHCMAAAARSGVNTATLNHPQQRLDSGFPVCANCLENSLSTVGLSQNAKAQQAGIPLFGDNVGLAELLAALGMLQTEEVVDESPLSDDMSQRTLLHPPSKMLSGYLPNGFSYVILPNEFPPERFSAYLEVGTGSVNERDDQQGIAHYVEHSVFCGTEKYPQEEVMRKLFNAMGMSFGGDTNAFTSFRQTVYQFHSPTGATDVGKIFRKFHSHEQRVQSQSEPPLVGTDLKEGEIDNLVLVLDLLNQLGFHATMRATEQLKTEKQAVLSEKELRDTLESRESVAMMEQVYNDSVIAKRMPIGKVRMIEKFNPDMLREWYSTWYYPGNMCLYMVGDFDPQVVLNHVTAIFGTEPARFAVEVPREPAIAHDDNYNALIMDGGHPLAWGLPIVDRPAQTNLAANPGALQGRGITPCQSTWKLPGRPMLTQGPRPAQPAELVNEVHRPTSTPYKEFISPLLTAFSVNLQFRTPMYSRDSEEVFRLKLIDSVIGTIFDHRVARLVGTTGTPPLMDANWGYTADWAMNGGLNAYAFATRPSKWRDSIRHGVRELRRMYQYGVSQDELDFAVEICDGMMDTAAQDSDAQYTYDIIDALLETRDSLGVYIENRDVIRIWGKTKRSLSVPVVKERVKYLLEPFFTFTGKPDQSVVSVFVTKPTYYEYDEMLDPADVATIGGQATEVPTYKVVTGGGSDTSRARRRFAVPREDILAALEEELRAASPGTSTFSRPPTQLLSEDELASYSSGRPPASIVSRVYDFKTDIYQCKMSNGMALNYKSTDTEPGIVTLRLAVGGGWACARSFRDNPDMALPTMLDSGIGRFNNEQLAFYQSLHGMALSAQSGESCDVLEITFNFADDSFTRALEMLHLCYTQPKWDPDALQRVKLASMLGIEMMDSNLEQSTLTELMAVAFHKDPRFCLPSITDINSLTLEDMQALFRQRFVPSNTEIIALGDFDPEKLEAGILKYLGCIPPNGNAELQPSREIPIACINCDVEVTFRPAQATVALESARHKHKAKLHGMGPELTGAVLGSHSISGSRGAPSMPQKSHDSPMAAARTVSTQSRQLLVGPAPVPSSAIDLEGPLPSLEGLNICSRVELTEDASRGVIYIVMPCANGWGELRTDKATISVAVPDVVPSQGNQSVDFAKELSDKSVTTRDLIALVESGQVSAQDVLQLLNVLEDRNWTREEILSHPRYVERCMLLFQAMKSEQLFRVIRGEKGLCYAISFGMSMTDFYETGTANVYCNAFPDEHRLRYTLLEIIKVLQEPVGSFTQEDFDAAKTPLIAQEQMDLLTNGGLWLDKMTGLQLPFARKRLDETHDLVSYLKALTLQDVQSVATQYFHPNSENLYIGLGVSHAPDEVVNRSHPHRQGLNGSNLCHPVRSAPSHAGPQHRGTATAGLRPELFKTALNPSNRKKLGPNSQLPLLVRTHKQRPTKL